MKLVRKNTYPLNKCYSINLVHFEGRDHIVVAAEKDDPCFLFDDKGNYEDTVWTPPGGTMSIVPWPGEEGVFLASRKMYSPNNASDAEIIVCRYLAKGKWDIRTLVKVPFVHRFDILSTGTKRYLIAATIKSGCAYTDDWSSPGQILAAELPEDITSCGDISLSLVKSGLLKNHGYARCQDTEGDYSVISAENGVFAVHPPSGLSSEWTLDKLLDEPTSDIAFADMDGDGRVEMFTLSPFHGDTVRIFSQDESGRYVRSYEYPQKLEFVHSLWAGEVYGKPYAVIGHRKGTSRDLYGISYAEGTYHFEVLDKDVGSTNVFRYRRGNTECMVSTNREINEIAFYDMVPDEQGEEDA